MDLQTLLLIDIETVPQHSAYFELDQKWQDLWKEKASKMQFAQEMLPEASYLERAGILAEFGKVICISTAYFFTDADKKVKLKQKTISGHDEKELLLAFIGLCNQFLQFKKAIVFGGHNIKEFDIPYICRRLIINGIHLPVYFNIHGQKPWENHHFDTLHWWRFGDYKNYITLKLLAASLGIKGSKDAIDGSMVRTVYYDQNNIEAIADYCAKDVQVVAQIILRYFNRPLLEDADFIC